MRAALRVLVCALAGAALLTGGAWAFARWERGVVAALDLPGAGHCLMSALHTQEALDAQTRASRDRLLGKQEVVADLLEGRLSLHEAADEFRRINAEKAEAEAAGQPAANDTTDSVSDEAVYTNLLTWLDARAGDKPQWDARAGRLRAELQGLLHRPVQGA